MDKKNLEAELAGAAVFDPLNGNLRGHVTVMADGRMIVAPPGRLKLAASVEKGVYIGGLKEGERLASKGEMAKWASPPQADKVEKPAEKPAEKPVK